jgi:hypothetical protein
MMLILYILLAFIVVYLRLSVSYRSRPSIISQNSKLLRFQVHSSHDSSSIHSSYSLSSCNPLRPMTNSNRNTLLYALICSDGSLLEPPGPPTDEYLSIMSNYDHHHESSLLLSPPMNLTSILFDRYSYMNIALLSAGNNTSSSTSNKPAKKDEKKPRKKPSGLLVILLPSLIVQFAVLQRAVPFIISRLSQYLSPVNVMMSLALQHRQGRFLFNTVLWTGIFLGAVYMVVDTFTLGASWTPLSPSNESFALVTGAASGLGLDIAKTLYLRGYNLILTSSNETALALAKEEIIMLGDNQPTEPNSSSSPAIAEAIEPTPVIIDPPHAETIPPKLPEILPASYSQDTPSIVVAETETAIAAVEEQVTTNSADRQREDRRVPLIRSTDRRNQNIVTIAYPYHEYDAAQAIAHQLYQENLLDKVSRLYILSLFLYSLS